MICIVTRGARISMTDEDFTIALNFRLLPFIISEASSGFARYQIARRLSGAAIVHASRVIYPKMSSCLCLTGPCYCLSLVIVGLFCRYAADARARARARAEPFWCIRAREHRVFPRRDSFSGRAFSSGLLFRTFGQRFRNSGIQFSLHPSRTRARARASARLSRYCCVLALCSGICLLIQVLTLASLVIFLS